MRKFNELLQEFQKVIDPAPQEKYNGYYGDSDTRISFVEKLLAMDKTYSPNYS